MKDKIIHLAKQRRVWGAILAAASAALISLGYPEISQVLTVIAGALGLHSYMKPKQ